jgi:hypothetical protein
MNIASLSSEDFGILLNLEQNGKCGLLEQTIMDFEDNGLKSKYY